MAEFVEVMKNKFRMCKSYHGCDACPLGYHNNDFTASCSNMQNNHPETCEEIVMKWAKEHPIVTNRDKFKEVFGVDIPDTMDGLTLMQPGTMELYYLPLDEEYKKPEEQ